VYITTVPDFSAVPSASTRSVARRRATVAPWLTCGACSPMGGKPWRKRVEEADSRVPPPSDQIFERGEGYDDCQVGPKDRRQAGQAARRGKARWAKIGARGPIRLFFSFCISLICFQSF
jgi:hypothetical protein